MSLYVNVDTMVDRVLINESFGDVELPEFLLDDLKNHSTSLGDNGAFPRVVGDSFDYILCKEAYKRVCDEADNYGFVGMPVDELETRLSRLIIKCVELEKPNKNVLEASCMNAVNKWFRVPEDTIILNVSLVTNIKPKKGFRINQDSIDNFSFEDSDDVEEFSKEVHKRRVVNSIIQGASSELSELMISNGIEGTEKLIELYNEILTLNEYLLFLKKDKIDDRDPMQGGYVEVTLGMRGNKNEISAQGVIFPFLLRETVRGFFEMFSAYGLPDNKKRAQCIIRRADFIKAEPWDMRFGRALFSKLFDGRVCDIPYMFTELVSLDTDEFNRFMKDVLSGSKSGKRALEWLHSASCDDAGSFNTEPTKNLSKTVINDDEDNSDAEIVSERDGDDDDVFESCFTPTELRNLTLTEEEMY